ncbi:dimethylglycine oxidase [Aspergillus awamori]|uniref:Dimethylglycine oxidase n=1 Tax=Aspergillus awamori TaxID=105351 RepID=A0A401KTT7_ASPAW|nr:dimethylglycine oxidase [Aspergillus awamori]GKZ53720.1 hypothetical protein AnigIFM49718_007597 [Aspergillus niger]
MQSTQPADIAIIGGGIVGSALAYYLSQNSHENRRIILLDRSLNPLNGSTGHAPGFVGQYNDSAILTRLAIDTVQEYTKIPGGFDTIGGLELATSQTGAERLQRRHDSASAAGLPARLISPEEAARMAPALIKKEDVTSALYFASDGAANATRITTFYQDEARSKGVECLELDVTGIHKDGNGRVDGVNTATAGFIPARTVILATGIWAPELLPDINIPIPIVPVAHPYMYGPYHAQKKIPTPWIRWPDHHVYARDHGPFYGLGSYNHAPVAQEPKDTAIGEWITEFDDTLKHALGFIPSETGLTPRETFNGIFSMTPDNLPLVGEVPGFEGVYLAAAVWVTHAAGVARFLCDVLEGREVDGEVKGGLDPGRFGGKDEEKLKEVALGGYNEIYRVGGVQ